jgi:pseudouridine-5'-phosphate glycosidase
MSREVEEAVVRQLPVVALETTLVAHGFPHPAGVETALAAEAAVRAAGAIPATIGLIDGALRVGLTVDELERMARDGARKVGPRDLAATLVEGGLGATTVAGTLAVATLCGIRFLATGGIGGVHRGGGRDVSADLAELARSQVCVVSSGIKSLLDVPDTLELLETLSIPVVGFGTDVLPLFYARESSHPTSARVDSPAQAAALCRVHWELDRRGSILVANPPPAESALEEDEATGFIESALREADREGVRGPGVTPFVLARVHAGSGGRTERVNRELIVANASLAGEIAAAWPAD